MAGLNGAERYWIIQELQNVLVRQPDWYRHVFGPDVAARVPMGQTPAESAYTVLALAEDEGRDTAPALLLALIDSLPPTPELARIRARMLGTSPTGRPPGTAQRKPPAADRASEPSANDLEASLVVFLCHSSSDKPAVRRLGGRLRQDGHRTWLDEEALLPGQEWDPVIREAVRAADIVLVCLSRDSVTKAGYVQKEIRHVLDVADEQPEGTIFVIPARLEECEVPERLKRWQWVDLHKRGGYRRLLAALREAGRFRS